MEKSVKNNGRELCFLASHTGVCEILHALYVHGEMLTSKLQRKLPLSPETFYKARKVLEDNDLIELVSSKSRKTKPYRLTEKGKVVAREIDHLTRFIRER
ncbi:MAG: helix-turn-helix transcriptional regulator [Thermoplasmata archaeon]|nr:helix-turn-helix transcriptional regulator [Thermoplasmata archaeon]